MKIKTSELTGPALDWAVAKCEGLLAFIHHEDAKNSVVRYSDGTSATFKPSTDWSQGGPIIERERIAIWTPMTQFKQSEWVAGQSYVENGEEMEVAQEFYGPTPLIAAMRCFCASKLGDEVDVPEELV